MVLGIIVLFVCLIIVVGLCILVGEYFSEVFLKISYCIYVILFCVISFVIVNFGLKVVIEKFVLMLLIFYLIVMIVILVFGINVLY